MEIYWDALAWARAYLRASSRPSVYARTRLRCAIVASRWCTLLIASPELPQYHALEGTAPRWRDLIGYYTRFGDVRELYRRWMIAT